MSQIFLTFTFWAAVFCTYLFTMLIVAAATCDAFKSDGQVIALLIM